MQSILVVDDEADIINLIRIYAEKEGYSVIAAENGADAVELFKKNPADLVVMDVMMDGIDGFEASSGILAVKKVPIIMLTALSSESDKLKGFDLGVVDYMVKPFSPRELMARIKVSLQRYVAVPSEELSEDEIKTGDIVVNKSEMTVKINGSEVDLTLKEFELLTCFIRNSGVVLSRRDIMDIVWNGDRFMNERVVDSQIKLLRKKIKRSSSSIITYRGVGYKFIAG